MPLHRSFHSWLLSLLSEAPESCMLAATQGKCMQPLLLHQAELRIQVGVASHRGGWAPQPILSPMLTERTELI